MAQHGRYETVRAASRERCTTTGGGRAKHLRHPDPPLEQGGNVGPHRRARTHRTTRGNHDRRRRRRAMPDRLIGHRLTTLRCRSDRCGRLCDCVPGRIRRHGDSRASRRSLARSWESASKPNVLQQKLQNIFVVWAGGPPQKYFEVLGFVSLQFPPLGSCVAVRLAGHRAAASQGGRRTTCSTTCMGAKRAKSHDSNNEGGSGRRGSFSLRCLSRGSLLVSRSRQLQPRPPAAP